jgi:mercuric ion transport protein
MKPQTLLKTSIVGTVIALVCCFTPVLVILFGVLGLSAYVGWLDMVILPILALFLILTGYALWKCKKAA